MAVPPLTSSVASALAAFSAAIRAEYGSRVKEIVLFGSYARAEATPESDVDVAVVIEGLTGAEGRAIGRSAGDLLTEHGVLISAFTVSAERMDLLRSRERMIAAEIARDGIPL